MLGNVSKAIASGLSAAATGEGLVVISAAQGGGLPDWFYAAVPAINFVVGFTIAYWFPKNSPS